LSEVSRKKSGKRSPVGRFGGGFTKSGLLSIARARMCVRAQPNS